MSALPRVIITDFGGVLVDFVPLADRENFYGRCSVSREDIRKFFKEGAEFRAYEKGIVTTPKFFEAVQAKLGFRDDISKFETAFCDTNLSLKKDIYNLFFCEMKTRYDSEFWILSNIAELHYRYARGKWPGIFSNCRRVFLSCEMGTRKPEPEIYTRVLEDGGATPYECLFIDDAEVNCRAAGDFFDYVHHFRGIDELRLYLFRNFGIGN